MTATPLDAKAGTLARLLADLSVHIEHDQAVRVLRERLAVLRASERVGPTDALGQLDDAVLARIASASGIAAARRRDHARRTAWNGPANTALSVEGAAATAAQIGQALLQGRLPAPGEPADTPIRCMTGLCEAIARRGRDGAVLVPATGLALAEDLAEGLA